MTKDFKKIIYSLHPLERKVLGYLNLEDVAKIAKKILISEAETTTGLLMLANRGYLVENRFEQSFICLDKFGEKFVGQDLPEIKFLKHVFGGQKKQEELKLDKEEFSSAVGVLKREKLVEVKNDNGLVFTITNAGKDYLKNNSKNPLIEFKEDVLVEDLTDYQKKIIKNFEQRKGFLKQSTKKSFSIKLTKQGKELLDYYNKNFKNLELIEALTEDMLKNKSWKNKEFRHYDINVATTLPQIGRRHPMIEANNILRDVFVEMGFCEMSGPMVESAFWNMDVMWIPQDHPARDEQDTFYLDGVSDVPEDIMKKVKNMHEKGIKKTHTKEGEWSEDITRKTLLRTHSTATTFRTLSELGKKQEQGENVNGKYFYLANVFRNEAVDATHLAEFFQAEGFIVGDNLGLADLMGFVKEYYAKLGITQIRFKPTFNPYTEPSMEAHYYDPKMDKWYALINSGIFRAETLEPFGLQNKTVIAWGMGASRVAALLANKDSMRDITGATCDFEWLKSRPQMRKDIVRRND